MTGLDVTARSFAAHRCAELALSELLGQWATDPETNPLAAPTLAALCHHHAWHGELFAARIPSVAQVDDVVAPGEIHELLAQARSSASLHDRLAVVHGRVLPALIEGYERQRATIDPRVDGPSARVLTLVLRDLTDDRDELAELLDRLG